MGNMKMMMMAVVMAVMMAAIRAAMGGVVYKVGDSAGWTNIGHVDYKTWASTKRFRVGDSIVFTFNKDFQNVVRVTYDGYLNCNGTVSFDTYTSGNDTFPIKFPGHYFFICTLPGHCTTGQKVDIRVPIAADYNYPPPATSDSPIQPLPFPYPPPSGPSPSPPVVKSPSIQSPSPSLVKESPSTPPANAAPQVAPAPTPKSLSSKVAINFEVLTTALMAVLVYLIAFSS